MTFSVDELVAIRDLPDFLRTEHCYNDLQHAMLVVLFRHGLNALRQNQIKLADRIIDNISLYLYIHFLNEEEGLVYKSGLGLLERDVLEEHSEQHLHFLDCWRDTVLMPYKTQDITPEKTIENVSAFYNAIIKHIDHEDLPTYGANAIAVEHTRRELARIAQTNMPMSPFMPGAFEALSLMDKDVAEVLNKKTLSPRALEPISHLNLVPNVGRVLSGTTGSLRDRFAASTGKNRIIHNTHRIYMH